MILRKRCVVKSVNGAVITVKKEFIGERVWKVLKGP
jgi:putative transposon-encoded protein